MTRMMAGTAMLAAALVLAACGRNDHDTILNNAAAAKFTPPTTRMPTPIPGQRQSTPLTAYIGKYPHDAVAGVDFFDRTEVATALHDAVGDPGIRSTVVARSGPETPIFRIGTRLAAWGCVAHECADRDWTLFVPVGGGQPALCYHDGRTMGQDSAWYEGGAPERRADACPSEPPGQG